MDRERFQRIKDIVVFILLLVFLGTTAYGIVMYGALPVGETPVWLLWVMSLYIVWGCRRDG